MSRGAIGAVRRSLVGLSRLRGFRRVVPVDLARRIDSRLFGTGRAARADHREIYADGTIEGPAQQIFRVYRFMGRDHLHRRVDTLADNVQLQVRLGALAGSGKRRTVVICGNGRTLNAGDLADLARVTTIGSNFVHLPRRVGRVPP